MSATSTKKVALKWKVTGPHQEVRKNFRRVVISKVPDGHPVKKDRKDYFVQVTNYKKKYVAGYKKGRAVWEPESIGDAVRSMKAAKCVARAWLYADWASVTDDWEYKQVTRCGG